MSFILYFLFARRRDAAQRRSIAQQTLARYVEL
jgi:hypothetical protein